MKQIKKQISTADILTLIVRTSTATIKAIETLDKRIKALEKKASIQNSDTEVEEIANDIIKLKQDVKVLLNSVSHENATEFPPVTSSNP